MTALPTVRLKTVASSRGPWIFRKMVDAAEPRTEPGAIVRVVDREGGFVAQAFWNPKSELSLRVLTRVEDPPIDDGWLRRAVSRAVALRRETLKLDKQGNAWRAVFSEADQLPGLIVDRYGDVASCQVASLGIYRAFRVIAEELKLRLPAKVIHVAADPKIAKLEGFPVPDGAGDAARTVIRENGLDFEVDCAQGHKTGFFLDQRDSRRRIRELARGKKVLDLFCYSGGFALNAAKGEARDVTGVDLDEHAVAQAGRNAKRNGFDAVRFVHADAFGFLRGLTDRGFDIVVVDPAKQAANRTDLTKALHYYEDLNTLAFAKVAEGGLVLSCSCSGVVSEPDFLESLSRAARNARREATFLEVTGAPADHPVPADFPQARYLKCVLVRVL